MATLWHGDGDINTMKWSSYITTRLFVWFRFMLMQHNVVSIQKSTAMLVNFEFDVDRLTESQTQSQRNEYSEINVVISIHIIQHIAEETGNELRAFEERLYRGMMESVIMSPPLLYGHGGAHL